MNILITGIHGFVGNNLVAALKEQHTIYGIDIVSRPKDGVVKTFGWNELKNIPPIDCIIHLAGKAHDTKRGGDVSTNSTTEGERGRNGGDKNKSFSMRRANVLLMNLLSS